MPYLIWQKKQSRSAETGHSFLPGSICVSDNQQAKENYAAHKREKLAVFYIIQKWQGYLH